MNLSLSHLSTKFPFSSTKHSYIFIILQFTILNSSTSCCDCEPYWIGIFPALTFWNFIESGPVHHIVFSQYNPALLWEWATNCIQNIHFLFSFQSSYLVFSPSSRFHATNGKRFLTWKARWWTPGIEQRRGWCSNDTILGCSRETWFLVQCIVVIRFHKGWYISHLPKGTNI